MISLHHYIAPQGNEGVLYKVDNHVKETTWLSIYRGTKQHVERELLRERNAVDQELIHE